MKRIIPFLTLALLPMLASCAYPAPHYTVRPVTGYIPPQDDARTLCTVAQILVPVLPSDSVWARCEWWQSGSLLKSDSTRTPRAVYLLFSPPAEVPSSSPVGSTVYLRDVGGTSCSAYLSQTPTVTYLKPAAFTGLTLAP